MILKLGYAKRAKLSLDPRLINGMGLSCPRIEGRQNKAPYDQLLLAQSASKSLPSFHKHISIAFI